MSIRQEKGPAAGPPRTPGPSPTPQQLASRLLMELYRVTRGRAMQHHRIEFIAAAAGIVDLIHQELAVAHGVAAGLIEVIEGHSICLTDEGRLLLR